MWWAWVVYSWLTDATSAEENVPERLILFAAMTVMVVVALAIPGAFSETALVFGVAYFVVRSLPVLLYTLTASASGEDTITLCTHHTLYYTFVHIFPLKESILVPKTIL